jgi:hypothetical protein
MVGSAHPTLSLNLAPFSPREKLGMRAVNLRKKDWMIPVYTGKIDR